MRSSLTQQMHIEHRDAPPSRIRYPITKALDTDRSKLVRRSHQIKSTNMNEGSDQTTTTYSLPEYEQPIAYNSDTVAFEKEIKKRQNESTPGLAEEAFAATKDTRYSSLLNGPITTYFQVRFSECTNIETASSITSASISLASLNASGYLDGAKSVRMGMLNMNQRVIDQSSINPSSIGIHFGQFAKKQANSPYTFTTYPIHTSPVPNQLYYEPAIKEVVFDTITDTPRLVVELFDSCGLIEFENPCRLGSFEDTAAGEMTVTTCFDASTVLQVGDTICIKDCCSRRSRYTVITVNIDDFVIETPIMSSTGLDGKESAFVIEPLDWSFEFSITCIPSRQGSGLYRLRS